MNIKKFLTVLVLGIAAFAVSCSESDSGTDPTIEYLYIMDYTDIAMSGLTGTYETYSPTSYSIASGACSGGITIAQQSSVSATPAQAAAAIADGIANGTLPTNIASASVSSIDANGDITITFTADSDYVIEDANGNKAKTYDVVIAVTIS